MELLLDPQTWLAFAALTALQIVLGIASLFLWPSSPRACRGSDSGAPAPSAVPGHADTHRPVAVADLDHVFDETVVRGSGRGDFGPRSDLAAGGYFCSPTAPSEFPRPWKWRLKARGRRHGWVPGGGDPDRVTGYRVLSRLRHHSHPPGGPRWREWWPPSLWWCWS